MFHYGSGCRTKTEELEKKIQVLESKISDEKRALSHMVEGNLRESVNNADLRKENDALMCQIHEGKAVYDYQVGELEKKIKELEDKATDGFKLKSAEDLLNSRADIIKTLNLQNEYLTKRAADMQNDIHNLMAEKTELVQKLQGLGEDFRHHAILAKKPGRPPKKKPEGTTLREKVQIWKKGGIEFSTNNMNEKPPKGSLKITYKRKGA